MKNRWLSDRSVNDGGGARNSCSQFGQMHQKNATFVNIGLAVCFRVRDFFFMAKANICVSKVEIEPVKTMKVPIIGKSSRDPLFITFSFFKQESVV